MNPVLYRIPVKPRAFVGGTTDLRMNVVHSIHRTAAEQRILHEVTNPKYSAWERDYLEWYHQDPLKRSPTAAQTHSYNNQREVLASKRCGCFHCGATFRPSAISEWMNDSIDRTALCPDCDENAVLGDASGYPLTAEFLFAMNKKWYDRD